MYRQEKMEARIQKTLSEVLQHHLKDPRVVGNVTISRVEVTNDISLAKIYFSILADDATRRQIMQTLDKAKGFLRTELAKELKIRHTPVLELKLDTSVERGMHIQHLLDEIKEEERS